MNLMECPEFRRLLQLLWKDLWECDIPHCTKLRELIVEAWYQYFDILKQDLAISVSLFDLASYHLFICSVRMQNERYRAPLTSGQT
jgi:hypothetical protein